MLRYYVGESLRDSDLGHGCCRLHGLGSPLPVPASSPKQVQERISWSFEIGGADKLPLLGRSTELPSLTAAHIVLHVA